jgi:hypothetical protein
MSFCPKCRYEYKEGIGTCPDCGVALVEFLSEGGEKRPQLSGKEEAHEDWIEIGKLESWQLAEMVMHGLRAKNIPAVVLSSSGYLGQLKFDGFSAFRTAGAYSLLVPLENVTDADKEAETILGDVWDDARIHDTE